MVRPSGRARGYLAAHLRPADQLSESWFGVSGLGFRIWGLGLRIWGLGLKKMLGFRIWGLGLEFSV